MEQFDLSTFKNKKLEILHELDRVCKECGIQYYLAYGTLLGAVRHNGFIPWDDDIDVFLTWDQMDKLMESRDALKENYFLQNRDTDPHYRNMKWMLRDSSTAFFANERDCDDINHGIGIDIYALYPYPDNWFYAHKLILDSYILRILYLRQNPEHHGKLAAIGAKILLSLISEKRAEKIIKRIENRLKHNGGKKYYSSFFGNDITFTKCKKLPIDSFLNHEEWKFEDYMAPCPNDSKRICEIIYGSTYMEYPPEEKRRPNHLPMIVEYDTPYMQYEGTYYNKNN